MVVTPPTASQNVASGGTVYHASQVLNQGNGTDSLDVTYAFENQTGSGTWGDSLYHDVNRNGIFDAGTDTLLDDSGSYTIADLAADSTFYVLLAVSTPAAGVDGDNIDDRLTATSRFDPSKTDDGVYTTTINAAAMSGNKTNDKVAPVEGETITYAVTVANTGSDSAYAVVVRDTIPGNTTYVDESMRRFNGGVGTFALADVQTDASDSPATDSLETQDTDGIVVATLGSIAPGDTVTIYFQVTVDAEVAEGVVISNDAYISFENGAGDPQPDVTAGPSTSTVDETNAVDAIAVKDPAGNVDDAPDSLDFNGDPGDTLYYMFDIQNTGNGTDSFELTTGSTAFPADSVKYFVDADEDGIPDDLNSPITNTGNLTQDQIVHLIALIVVPAGTGDGVTDETTITATSDDSGGVSDSIKVKTSVTAPLLTLQKYVNTTFTQDPASSDTTGSAAPGDTLYYTIVVSNAGTGSATSVVITDDGTGQGNTTYTPDSVSLTLGAPSLDAGTDKTDADNAGDDEVIVAAGNITTSLGSLTSGTVRTIRFKSVIN